MVYPIGKRFLKLILHPFIGRVNGLENIPKDKGFILAANHDSYIDHLVLATIFINKLNKNVHFLAKKELFDKPLKRLFHNWANAIPIDRQTGGKEALRLAIKTLKQGNIIIIHPEGTRSYDGKLQRGKTGMVRLALAAEVPILPVGLIGTFEILPKWKKIPKLKKAKINIGKLIYLDKYYGKEKNKKAVRAITTKIMKEIAKLTGERYNFD
ncbi:MAG: lysophospholipid acyltransferase family protein [Nanoarchaeota archaeon]|nr:lysophospholipid acyltransferase family protein [Nanoarchaeota archaeon]